MPAGVYQIRNTVTGKVYVGSSADMQARWDHHRTSLCRGDHHSHRLQDDWNDYGAQAFVFEALVILDAPDGLLDLEQRFIDALQAADGHHGYNVHPTAGGALGFKHSQETRRKMSATAKAQGRTPHISDEERAAVLAKIHALPRTPEWREAISKGNRGKTISPEVRAKISATLKAHFVDESNRGRLIEQAKKAANINKGNKYAAGRVMPPDELLRRAESMKKSHARRRAQNQEV